jgi:hypothetical protein
MLLRMPLGLGHIRSAALGAALAALASGCAPSAPPRWAEGGARLAIPEARWVRGNGDVIEIKADGKVIDDGDFAFLVDRAGRVVNDDYEPVAILLPDGSLRGTDNQGLGRVGVANGAPPGENQAWFSIQPSGNVVLFDFDGERSDGGKWEHCPGVTLRTCALVTQIVALRSYAPRSNVGIGVGIGIGVGY